MNLSDNPLAARMSHCQLLELEHHSASGFGMLTVAANGNELPIEIRRVFYIYEVPAGAVRGGHAHHRMNELIVAVSGCFDVELTDGKTTTTVTLRRPTEGLFIPAGVWRSLSNFSSGCVALTLCDTDYDESDYIRDYNEFIQLKESCL